MLKRQRDFFAGIRNVSNDLRGKGSGIVLNMIPDSDDYRAIRLCIVLNMTPRFLI